jgi:hypothetical protein
MTNLCLDFDCPELLLLALLVLLAVFVEDSLTTVTGLGGRLFLDVLCDDMTMGFFFFFTPMTMPPDFFMVLLMNCSFVNGALVVSIK